MDNMKKIKPDVHCNLCFLQVGRRTWILLPPTDVASSFPIRCWQMTSCTATYFILDTVFSLLIFLPVSCKNDDRYGQKIKIKQEISRYETQHMIVRNVNMYVWWRTINYKKMRYITQLCVIIWNAIWRSEHIHTYARQETHFLKKWKRDCRCQFCNWPAACYRHAHNKQQFVTMKKNRLRSSLQLMWINQTYALQFVNQVVDNTYWKKEVRPI